MSTPSLALHLACGLPRPHAHVTACLQSCSLSLSDWFQLSSKGIWLVTEHPKDWLALGHMSISCMSSNLAQMPWLYEFKGNCWVLATLPMPAVSWTSTSHQTRRCAPASQGFPPLAYYQSELPFYLLVWVSSSCSFIHLLCKLPHKLLLYK